MLKTIYRQRKTNSAQRVFLLGTASTEVKVVLWILLLFRSFRWPGSMCRRIKTVLVISII